jgi:hypothetical protein
VHLRNLPRGNRAAPLGDATGEDVDRGDAALVAAGQPHPVARVQRARPHAHVGDPLAGRAAVHLEHGPRRRARGVTACDGQQLRDRRLERVHAGARPRRPEEDRVHARGARLGDEGCPDALDRDRGLLVEVGGEQRVVVVGQELGQVGREPRVTGRVGHERGRGGAGGVDRADRHHVGRQPFADAIEHGGGARAPAIDLVDEEQRRHAQALERAHQHARLRLHALDRGDHEHRTVEDAEHALDLRDEIGMPGRVDEIHRDITHGERDDRGLDRDPTAPFELERVGLRVAVVDAADGVDHPGGVQQPLGEARLTGVDVGQDPQVQVLHSASCPPDSSG